jgi:tRNA-specific adenosine deaminase 1
MSEYQAAKQTLMGENGPFSGWIKSGKQWESFDADGNYQ